MPTPLLERAVELFPETGFVNAYGLTETSSTVALLGPEDHRAALSSEDPLVRARLGSVGRLLPGIELEVRGEDGTCLPVGETGLLFFRGEQIAGEYAGAHAANPVVDERVGSRAGTGAGSTRRATSSSKDGPTTPSSGAARTSPRPRSRTSSSPARGSSTPPSSAWPTTSGASAWWRSWCPRARPRSPKRI